MRVNELMPYTGIDKCELIHMNIITLKIKPSVDLFLYFCHNGHPVVMYERSLLWERNRHMPSLCRFYIAFVEMHLVSSMVFFEFSIRPSIFIPVLMSNRPIRTKINEIT